MNERDDDHDYGERQKGEDVELDDDNYNQEAERQP